MIIPLDKNALKPYAFVAVASLAFFLLLFGTFAAASMIDAMRAEREFSVGRTLFVYGVGFGHWLLLFPPIYHYASLDRFIDASVISKIIQALLLMLAALALLFLYLTFVAAPLYEQPIGGFLAEVSLVQWLWDLVLYVIVLLIGYLSGVSARNREAKIATAEMAQKLAQQKADVSAREAEYLRGRLGSHFVMNALSNLVGLMRLGHVREAEEATILLSDILRSMMSASGVDECISVEAEFEDAKKYLAFQQIRFPDLMTRYRIDDSARDACVPRQILQPLLENVFKHGPRSGGVTIEVEATIKTGCLCLCVRNNCGGRSADTTSEGEGMQLTRRRLAMACGPDSGVARMIDNDWYVVTLKVPLNLAEAGGLAEGKPDD